MYVGLSLALSNFVGSAAVAADSYPNSQVPEPAQSLPAVDGLNAKVAGFGGVAKGHGLYGAGGSLTMPLGFRYGLQIDGIAASADTEALGDVTVAGVPAHLFWRDPSAGLFGLYGHYLHGDIFSGADVFAGAFEGALYLGRFTIEGIAGAQGGKADLGALGDVNFDTRFIDVAQLAYYPIDDLKISIGHSYLFGTNSLLLGAEQGLPTGHGTMAALFVDGGVAEGGDATVLGGLRLYIGQSDKTLIRRHREDDPPIASPVLWAVIAWVRREIHDR
jgi:hypothetical protein